MGVESAMFACSEAGAWIASIIYSLIASCKLNDHDPFAYFNDVLRKVSIHPAEAIDELLPSNWKKPDPCTEDDDVVKEHMIKVA